MQVVQFYAGPCPKPSYSGVWRADNCVWPSSQRKQCGAEEGCCNASSRNTLSWISWVFSVCSAWILSVLMGHTPSTIWPALSLSDSTCIGWAVVGLFKYTAGSLPNVAPGTEIGRFLLNSWDPRCELVYELCKPFEKSECLSFTSKTVYFCCSWRGRYSSKTVR